MKNLSKILGLAALMLLTITACEKDDTYCIDNILNTGTMDIGAIQMTVPGEGEYTGVGALPGPFKFGKYEGEISSVIVKQTPTETGMDVELRHHYIDKNGDEFWTHDHAVMTSIGGSETRFTVYDEMAIFSGTGDFECAEGLLINEAVVDFATNKLEIKVTGRICGGCDN
jgi:hypothetical protein